MKNLLVSFFLSSTIIFSTQHTTTKIFSIDNRRNMNFKHLNQVQKITCRKILNHLYQHPRKISRIIIEIDYTVAVAKHVSECLNYLKGKDFISKSNDDAYTLTAIGKSLLLKGEEF